MDKIVYRYGKYIKYHIWTKEEEELLKREYRYSLQSIKDLASKLSVTESAVRNKLATLGILASCVFWTSTEIQFLEDNYSSLSAKQIAKKLGRSISSVESKAHRLKCSKKNRSGWFTEAEVGHILGVDSGWIRRRVKSGFILDMKPLNGLPSKGKNLPWKITEEALRDFIRTYPEELTGHNVDFVMLVDILAGIKVTSYRK